MLRENVSQPTPAVAYRLDRTAFAVATLDEPDDSVAFWRTKSPLERFAAGRDRDRAT